ncbi:MAG: hypothetical protein MZV63_25315 [Marinilabiliales bacterium]|nr:hypothetical protein [Marinilabiliales bacterium]
MKDGNTELLQAGLTTGFNYTPRYYDPKKEEWEARRAAQAGSRVQRARAGSSRRGAASTHHTLQKQDRGRGQ